MMDLSHAGIEARPNSGLRSCIQRAGVLLLIAAALLAQGTANRVSGLITDSSGGIIANAVVTAEEKATGVVTKTNSNDRGYYLLQLPIGVYDLRVSNPGFHSSVSEKVPVTVGAAISLDFTLQVGSSQETIQVSAEATLLRPESSSVQTTVDNKLVMELPLAFSGRARNSANFLTMTPGYQGNTSVARLNGGVGWNQSITVDGATVSPASFATGNQGQMIVPSFAVQEFQVVGNNPEAQDGRTSNGAIKYALKSGTNSLHGSAFEYLRNQALDARNFFSTAVALDNQHEFGVELGGPVVIPHLYNGHNRTFFYIYYDGYRFTNTNTTTYNLLTPAMRVGNFSAAGLPTIFDPSTTKANGQGGFTRTPYADNTIPANQISPISRYFAGLFPEPNRPGLTANYLGTSKSISQDDQGLIKINQALRNGSASASYNVEPQSVTNVGEFGPILSGSVNDNRGHRAIFNLDTTLSATRLNHFGASFNRWHLGTFGGGEKTFGVGSNLNTTAGLAQGPVEGHGAAAINAGGYTFPNTGTINYITHQNWRLSDDFTWHKGLHSWQFGVSMDRFSTSGAQNSISPLGNYTFSPQETGQPGVQNTGFAVASFLLGNVDTAAWGQQPWQAFLFRPWGLYAQDSWKILPKLTLNFGLRWEFEPPIKDKLNRIGNFDPDLPNPGAGNRPGALVFAGTGQGRSGKTQFADRYYGGFGPRIGLAYNARKNTVLRAGYTVNYDNADGASIFLNQQGFFTNARVSSLDSGVTPAFNWAIGFPAVQLGPYFSPTVANNVSTFYMQPNGDRLPMVQNWNVGIQQMFPNNMVLDVSYLGMGAHHLSNGLLNYNQLDPRYLSLGSVLNAQIGSAAAAGFPAPYAGFSGSVAQSLRPFPQYQNITLNANPIGNNTYNAFQVRGQKRFSSGLTFLISFNYAKNLTDAHGQSSGGYLGGAQNYYNVSLEKAVEANDVPHALAAAYSYQLPFGTGKRLRTGNKILDKYVISSWTTSGIWTVQDGKPLALTTQLSLPAAGAVRPNMVGSEVYLAHDRSTFDPAKDRYINRAAFALPAPFTFGNAPRLISQLRAFGTISWNVALLKSIPIRENLHLILRPEFFNVLNNVNFNAPNQDFSNLAFGQITAAGAPRQGQVSATLSW
jgi:hypothetical protein